MRRGSHVYYPPPFIDKVKTEYPDREDLHRALDMGGSEVGTYLNSFVRVAESKLKPDDIIRAFEGRREKEIYEAARTALRRGKLYLEWKDITGDNT